MYRDTYVYICKCMAMARVYVYLCICIHMHGKGRYVFVGRECTQNTRMLGCGMNTSYIFKNKNIHHTSTLCVRARQSAREREGRVFFFWGGGVERDFISKQCPCRGYVW